MLKLTKLQIANYLAFAAKSLFLFSYLPLAANFVSAFEGKILAQVLTSLYLVTAFEFGIVINLIRTSGSASASSKSIYSQDFIKKLNKLVFFLSTLACASVVVINYLTTKINLFENPELLIFLGLLMLSINAQKHFAILSGTKYLFQTKVVEAAVYLLTFLLLCLNSLFFLMFEIHFTGICALILFRAIALKVMSDQHKRSVGTASIYTTDFDDFLKKCFSTGFATFSSQLLINTFMSSAFIFGDREGFKINTLFRGLQGLIVAIRQYTTLEFAILAQATNQHGAALSRRAFGNIWVGVLIILSISIMVILGGAMFFLEGLSSETILYLLIASVTLVCMNIYGLSAQYLLLKDKVIHKYMLYSSLSSLVILVCWKYGLIDIFALGFLVVIFLFLCLFGLYVVRFTFKQG